MTPADLQQLLASHGFISRVHRDEVKMETCLYCGNSKYNLELNPVKGVFKCWACKEGGYLGRFLRDKLGVHAQFDVTQRRSEREHLIQGVEELHLLPLDRVPSAQAYLWQERRLDPSRMQEYGLAVCGNRLHKMFARLMIPVRDFWTQEHAGFVGRAYNGERPTYLADTADTLVGYRVREFGAPYFLVEGPFDGFPVHLAGFNVTVGLGKDALNRHFEHWLARVPLESRPVLLLDGDAAEFSEELRWRGIPIRADLLNFKLPPDLDPGRLDPETVRALWTHLSAKDG